MKFAIRLFVFLVAAGFSVNAQQQLVSISPQKPELGDQLTITFQGDSGGEQPVLVFSYSNFFELPNQLSMEKSGQLWKTTFQVPRYAKYASFYIKQGDRIFQPDSKAHYELVFYKDSLPVFDTYLYKSYSLQAQMGKSDSLRILGNRLIEKELELYPNNYAAKLRLLANKMTDDKANYAVYLAEGLKIVKAKFAENPTQMGNINQVTMGYLILGQNAQIDTLKELILAKYPNSEVAFEYLYEQAYKTKDEKERVSKLERLLDYKTNGESSTQSGIHQQLFEYYAKQKQEKKALFHARHVASVQNPWLPKELKELAVVLTENNLALDTARMYANKALSSVEDYPFGVIRYFPEYGYIPGYAANKPALVKAQRGEILSVIGSIAVQQKKYEAAERTLLEALSLSKNQAVYRNLAYLYEQTNRPKLAFDTYRAMLLQMPVDPLIQQKLQDNFKRFAAPGADFNKELEAVQTDWEKQNIAKLRATKLNYPSPVFDQVFDMQGKPVSPDFFKGKVLVLDFWATWCVPCIEGFPCMQQVYDQYKDNPNVVFMVMNSGSKNSLQDAVNWVKQNKFTFPFYYNDRKLAEAFQITTIPSTFIIDQMGKIRYKTVGFEGPLMQAKLALSIKDVLGSATND